MEERRAQDDEEEADGEHLAEGLVSIFNIIRSGKSYEGERNNGLETCRRHRACRAPCSRDRNTSTVGSLAD